MVPRPPPHPRLGKNKLPRGKKNRKIYFWDAFNVFYQKVEKLIPTWSQNGPKCLETSQTNNLMFLGRSS